MTTPLLEVQDLKKHYPAPGALPVNGVRPVVRSVDGISFQIPAGATMGLIGESGSGKSTTAKLLLRLEPPTSGRILFRGEEVQQAKGKALHAYRSEVQAVFQDPYSSLNPRRKVFDAIAEPLVAARTTTRAQIAERVGELLDAVGVSRRAANLLPHEFSGGQRQRIAIARGLALHPKLLILDEPVSALDVSIRAQILNLLQELQERYGVAYLLISHDLDVVAHMADTIAVMYLGRIVEQGPAASIRSAPQHPYTQVLFSSILPAHPDRRRDRIRLKGPPPSPLNPPRGCVFSTRCPVAIEACSELPPITTRTIGGGSAACHLISQSEADLAAHV